MQSPIVADVMSRPVISVDEDTAFKRIVDLLDEHSISAVPVVDRWHRPVGVVSEMDLVQVRTRQAASGSSRWAGWRGWKRLGRPRKAVASHLMSKHLQTLRMTERLDVATRRLARAGVRRLFVVDGRGALVGVFARRDALRVYLRPDAELVRVLRHELSSALWSDPAAAVRVQDGVVTLTGTLELRSDVNRALRLAHLVPGVVDVHSELRCRVDDVATQSRPAF